MAHRPSPKRPKRPPLTKAQKAALRRFKNTIKKLESGARHNPSTALERIRAAQGRAEMALAKTDSSTRDYERLRRELGRESKRAAAARYARAGVTAFPLGTMAVVTVIALAIGYQIGKPAATAA